MLNSIGTIGITNRIAIQIMFFYVNFTSFFCQCMEMCAKKKLSQTSRNQFVCLPCLLPSLRIDPSSRLFIILTNIIFFFAFYSYYSVITLNFVMWCGFCFHRRFQLAIPFQTHRNLLENYITASSSYHWMFILCDRLWLVRQFYLEVGWTWIHLTIVTINRDDCGVHHWFYAK